MSKIFYGLPCDVRQAILTAQQAMGNEPLAVLALCESLGITARAESGMPEYIVGAINRRHFLDRNFDIVVNKDHMTVRRQRFSVAHLLGHCLFHWWKLPHEEYWENVLFRGGLSTKDEEKASLFACELLLPDPLVEEYIDGKQDFSIIKMATRFGVSEQVLSHRLGIPLAF